MFTADELAACEAATREAPRPPEVRIVGEVLSMLGTPAGLRDIQVRSVPRPEKPTA